MGLPLAALALLSSACGSQTNYVASGSGGADGGFSMPVAHNAGEAFPDKPASVPVLTAEDIVRACALRIGCTTLPPTQSGRLAREAGCIYFVIWSAERAIPISSWPLWYWNERAGYFVRCTLRSAGDCRAIGACGTSRLFDMYCEEDGCDASLGAPFTCDGSVASIQTDGGVVTRDCARAYARCDPSSVTGCTDRHFTACPPGGTKADHCDGNVRLGCDRLGYVSYHDCARMGGICGVEPDGREGCIYNGGKTDPRCQDLAVTPRCVGSKLEACALGQFVSLDAPGICRGPWVAKRPPAMSSWHLVPGASPAAG